MARTVAFLESQGCWGRQSKTEIGPRRMAAGELGIAALCPGERLCGSLGSGGRSWEICCWMARSHGRSEEVAFLQRGRAGMRVPPAHPWVGVLGRLGILGQPEQHSQKHLLGLYCTSVTARFWKRSPSLYWVEQRRAVLSVGV